MALQSEVNADVVKGQEDKCGPVPRSYSTLYFFFFFFTTFCFSLRLAVTLLFCLVSYILNPYLPSMSPSIFSISFDETLASVSISCPWDICPEVYWPPQFSADCCPVVILSSTYHHPKGDPSPVSQVASFVSRPQCPSPFWSMQAITLTKCLLL